MRELETTGRGSDVASSSHGLQGRIESFASVGSMIGMKVAYSATESKSNAIQVVL